jgi:uncharacterized protein (TIGR00255 family)
MINSMTAFARAQAEQDGLTLSWELRSVNHRYLETQFRMPELLRPQEFPLREILRKHLKRGKIDCTLRVERAEGQPAMGLNRPLLLEVLAVIEQVKRDAPEMGPVNPMDLLRWPGILGDSLRMDDTSITQRVGELFEEALSQLIAHRAREGAGLNQAICQRLDEIDTIVMRVQALMADNAGSAQVKLQQRLAELDIKADPDRLEQEIALLVQRADVAEELDRLTIHVEEARGNLKAKGPHGRRLDFLTQELNREANTLGAKSSMAETSQKAVDLKVVIEQIREQVQNVE